MSIKLDMVLYPAIGWWSWPHQPAVLMLPGQKLSCRWLNRCKASAPRDLSFSLQVMLAKNLDVPQGLVNGARGVVVGFESEQKGK